MEALKTLITRAQTGDLSGYGEIVRRFQGMAVGYAYSILGDFHLAEDAAQEAFIEAYQCLPNLRDPDAFPGWFRKIVFKQCDRLLRRKSTEIVPLESAVGLHSETGDPLEFVEIQEMKDSVLMAIAALPVHERAVTTLFYIDGFSQNEIADFLEIPVTTVNSRLRYSRKRLKERMITMVQKTVKEKRPTNLDLASRGKVRDLYDLGEELLIISTDRISAFDVVLPNRIPHKGQILTELSEFWFDYTKSIVDNHIITTDVSQYPDVLQVDTEVLQGRSMLVRKANRIDIECVVRGYIAGSAWSEYQADGTVCGEKLPAGLTESERLPEPIFTPATKADHGEHDENISIAEMEAEIGKELSEKIIQTSFALFEAASEHAEKSGIILCDTKFEFGQIDGQLILIDEVFTPDSSRFWSKDEYKPGSSPPSFDKQYVRDYLSDVGWNKEPPAPELPAEVISQTSKKYLEAYRLIVGREFPVQLPLV